MPIAVVGSINMDTTVTVGRIPNKGETLIGDSISYIPGGKGANQAVAMAKLGAQVDMFGCVGDDNSGRVLVDNLQQMGVGVDHIKTIPGISTGTAFITVGEQDNTIIVVPGANGKVDCSYIDSIASKLGEYDMVVLQHEIPIETVIYVVDLCAKLGTPVILNPAPAIPVSLDIIEKVAYLTPNEHEARILFGSEEQLAVLLRRYPEKLVITQGSRGVSTCLASGEIITVPARKTNVVDTTGAGDTLNGAFAVQIVAGKNIKEALEYANIAASLSVEKFGAQGGMPDKEEVERVLLKV